MSGTNTQAVLRSVAGEEMALRSVSAAGRADGLLLEMTVRQHYHNVTGKTVETVYVFPMAFGATLMDLAVEIGGERLTGVVVARREAEDRYEEAIAEGDTPIMLETTSAGLYSVSLGNLKPGEEAVIEYRYAQLLRFEQGKVRIGVPTAIAPRYGDEHEEGGLKQHQSSEASLWAEYPFALSLSLHGALARGSVECPSHAVQVSQEPESIRVDLTRNGYLDRDFILNVGNLWGESFCVRCPDGDGVTALASFCPEVTVIPQSAVDLKILVDCSGSMAGASIASARRGLLQVLEELGPQDRFSYSQFGSEIHHIFNGLRKASGFALLRARARIRRTDADMGGTEMNSALQSTFRLEKEVEQCDVLLITDGEVWDVDRLIGLAKSSGHRIFAIGVGMAAAETLLQELAEQSGGACEIVSPNEDIEAAIARIFRRMRLSRASGIEVDWAEESLWATKPPLAVFDGDTIHVFAGFSTPPESPPTLSYQRSDGERVSVKASAWSQGTETLARMAAAARLREIPRDKQVALATKYQLLSSGTSYFLVHRRGDQDRAAGLPELQQIRHMRGQSLMSSALACLDIPAFMRLEGSDSRQSRSIYSVSGPSEARTQNVVTQEGLIRLLNENLRAPEDFHEVLSLLKGAILDTWVQAAFQRLLRRHAEEDAWVMLLNWLVTLQNPVLPVDAAAMKAIEVLSQRFLPSEAPVSKKLLDRALLASSN